MDTVKQTPEHELSFIGKVIKKSFDNEKTTWDITVAGSLVLAVACNGNPGMALYMLNEINPEPDSLITDTDVVARFPMGFTGDWEAIWDEFKQTDQHKVFKR